MTVIVSILLIVFSIQAARRRKRNRRFNAFMDRALHGKDLKHH
jgi:hypothetical protein